MEIEKNENKVGREIMRLMAISRDSQEKILDEALAGREMTVDSVARLFGFVVKNFGQRESAVTDKFWAACAPFLEEAGVDAKQLNEIRYPFLEYGQKGFRSILDEMKEEGHEL
jgi:hypothetical protein